MRFSLVTLDGLRIEDERSLARLGLYPRLKQLLLRDRYRFRVARARIDWNRAVLLNLSFWSPDDTADVLVGRSIPADVVAHVAWHHLARRSLGAAGRSVDGMLLGESIASAFDVYLMGRLLTDAPRSRYLESQVEALRELFPARALTGLLTRIARDPNAAFGALRALLFSVATSLTRARGIDDAARRLAAFDVHDFASLLPHYNVSNWILHSRAYGPPVGARIDAHIASIDRALCRAPVALDWLERHWLRPSEAPATARRSR